MLINWFPPTNTTIFNSISLPTYVMTTDTSPVLYWWKYSPTPYTVNSLDTPPVWSVPPKISPHLSVLVTMYRFPIKFNSPCCYNSWHPSVYTLYLSSNPLHYGPCIWTTHQHWLYNNFIVVTLIMLCFPLSCQYPCGIFLSLPLFIQVILNFWSIQV